MTYSLETIPAKIFFKIQETGDTFLRELLKTNNDLLNTNTELLNETKKNTQILKAKRLSVNIKQTDINHEIFRKNTKEWEA